MQKDLRTLSHYFLFFFVLFLASCNSNSEEKKEEKDASTTQPPKQQLLSSGAIDTLYIDRKAFDTLASGAKLVFSFTFKDADTLTLHGWAVKGTAFDSLPNMILKNYVPGTSHTAPYTYGVGTYFGNIVLLNKDIVKIKAALTSTMNFVMFAPKMLGNNIKYDILVTDKLKSFRDEILVISGTGAEGNPSPPKTY